MKCCLLLGGWREKDPRAKRTAGPPGAGGLSGPWSHPDPGAGPAAPSDPSRQVPCPPAHEVRVPCTQSGISRLTPIPAGLRAGRGRIPRGHPVPPRAGAPGAELHRPHLPAGAGGWGAGGCTEAESNRSKERGKGVTSVFCAVRRRVLFWSWFDGSECRASSFDVTGKPLATHECT